MIALPDSRGNTEIPSGLTAQVEQGQCTGDDEDCDMVRVPLSVLPLNKAAVTEDFDQTTGDCQARVTDAALCAEARTMIAPLSPVMVKPCVRPVVLERAGGRIEWALGVDAEQLRTDWQVNENRACPKAFRRGRGRNENQIKSPRRLVPVGRFAPPLQRAKPVAASARPDKY